MCILTSEKVFCMPFAGQNHCSVTNGKRSQKRLFQPAKGMQSSRLLVKIHNNKWRHSNISDTQALALHASANLLSECMTSFIVAQKDQIKMQYPKVTCSVVRVMFQNGVEYVRHIVLKRIQLNLFLRFFDDWIPSLIKI